MASLSTGGLSKFRKWYTQYKAIHGTEPPQDLMDTYLSSEMEAEMANQERSRQVSLQEKGLDIQRQGLEQRKTEFAEDLKMKKDAIKAQEQADMVSGVKDIAGLGMEAYKTFKTPTASAQTTSPTASRTVTPSGFSNAPDRGYGGGDGGYGAVAPAAGAGRTGVDLSNMTYQKGYGSQWVGGGDVTGGANVAGGSEALSTQGTGGINWGGLKTAGTSLAIGAANRYVSPMLEEKAYAENPEAGKSLNVVSGALEGFAAGRNYGPAGMIVGTVLGTERAGWRQGNEGGEIFDKDYNKSAGFASMFGITAGQVENKSDTKTVKTAKAIMTGGVSHIAGKLKTKLKKLF